MSEPDTCDIALRVAGAMQACGIEYALASSLQGEPRSTNGLDFAVRRDPEKLAALSQLLGPDFAFDERSQGSWRGFFHPSLLSFMRGDAPLDESEFSRKRRVEIDERGALFVASPEDNILRKRLWFRLGREVSDQQWRDVLGILRASGAPLDRDYLARWAADLGIADLLSRVLAQA